MQKLEWEFKQMRKFVILILLGLLTTPNFASAANCLTHEGKPAIRMGVNWHLVLLNQKPVVIDEKGDIVTEFPKDRTISQTQDGFFIENIPNTKLFDAHGILISDLSTFFGDGFYDIHFEIILGNDFYKAKQVIIQKINSSEWKIKYTSKWGIIDGCGRSVSEFIYDEINFGSNFIYYKIGDLWGAMDDKGQVLFQPKFRQIGGFSKIDGKYLSPVENDHLQWGYIDETGNTVLGFRFGLAESFSPNGLAAATDWEKWGYINKNGEWQIAPKFEKVHSFNIENEAEVMTAEINPIDGKRIKKWGIINEKGDWILEPKYLVSRSELGLPSVDINKYGHRIINAELEGELKGVIDRHDKIIIPKIYQELKSFDNIERGDGKRLDLLMYKTNDKWGLLSANGEKITEPIYDEMSRYSYLGETALVIRDGKVGYINKNGEEIITPRFDMADNFSKSDYAPVLIDGKMGFINKKGEIVIKPRFDNTFCPAYTFDQIDYMNQRDCRLKKDR